jgi:demethoxyubiquinone hydroxylase (CLK1/Coq7/Cat5 family)
MNMTGKSIDNRRKLVRLLRLAYSGEKAAAYAYAGHWRAVKNPAERAKIQKIERDEWEHRAQVKRMLDELGEKPNPLRELMMATIGRSVAISCFLIGWFLPMYFAGKLEHANVDEYDGAAIYAGNLGLLEFVPELHQMTNTEREHEYFFSKAIENHPLLPLMKVLFRWDPNEVIRITAEID